MAIAANILVILLELVGLCLSIGGRKWKIFAYYTQISNLIALCSSIAFLAFGENATWLRYLSSCMLTMTFLITAFVLVPMGGGLKKLMFSGNGLYHHTLCPVLSVLSYLLWEPHASIWLLPVAVTFLYGIIMLIMNAKEKFDGPYPFFRVHHLSVMATTLWMAALIGLITLISIGLILIR